jgi:chemotaxis protein CheY-P-specific phosphatase CheC
LTFVFVQDTPRLVGLLGFIPLVEKFDGEWDNKKLERYTALLTIKGALQVYFMFFVDPRLARTLVYQFILEEPKDDEEVLQYEADVIAEIANTIVGNALIDRCCQTHRKGSIYRNY